MIVVLALAVGMVLGAVGTVVIGACLASGQAARGEGRSAEAEAGRVGVGSPQYHRGPIGVSDASPALPHVRAIGLPDGGLRIEAARDDIIADWLARCS